MKGPNPLRNVNPEIRAAASSTPAGFTLIEVLVVIAILVIVGTIYYGGFSPDHAAKRNYCRQNLERDFLAMQIYANDNKGKFPVNPDAQTSEQVLDVLVPKYTSDTSTFICPASKDAPLRNGQSFRDWKISYAYYMGRFATNQSEGLMSDRQINTESKAKADTVFSITGKPPGNNHRDLGGNILLCDGSVIPSGTQTPVALPLAPSVILLNPKP